MGKEKSVITGVCLAVMLVASIVSAGPLEDSIWAVADRLEKAQIKDGSLNGGTWTGQRGFTGAIAAGLAGAYQVNAEARFKAGAERSGLHVAACSWAGYTGDEALCLARLSSTSPFFPCERFWRNAVLGFYQHVQETQGVEDYLSGFNDPDPSVNIVGIAYHVMAVYAVDGLGKEEWRKGLARTLGQVDDTTAHFPVLALGIATWALATSGPLDQTLIDPNGKGAACWRGKCFSDLPGLLLSHQVPAGKADAGSFFWRFDHGDAGKGIVGQGYTEDAVFGTLGLLAARTANPTGSPDLSMAIASAQQALLGGVGGDGSVRAHLSLGGDLYDVFGGEMAQVLAALAGK